MADEGAGNRPLYAATESQWRDYGESLGLELARYKGRDKVRAAVLLHLSQRS